MKVRSLFCALAALGISAESAEAQATWNVSSGNWSNGVSWVSGFPPANDGSASTYFGLGTTFSSTVNTNYSVYAVFIESTAGPFTLTNSGGATLTVGSADFTNSSSQSVSINVPLAGTMALIQNGTGTLTLSGNLNSYTGNTMVTAGTLTDFSANAYSPNSILEVGTPGVIHVTNNETVASLSDTGAGLGSVVISSGATLDLTGGYTGGFSGVISGAGNLQKDVTGTLTLTGTNTYTGTTVINGVGGTAIELGNGGITGSIASSGVSGTGTLEFDRSNSYTYSGTLSGALQIVQLGGGTTQLSGTNTNSGATTIINGTLQAGSTGAFSNSTEVLLSGSGALDLNGHNNSIDSVQSSTTASGIALSIGATLTLNDTSASSAIAGVISGTGSLNTSNYTVSVTGNGNTYSGGTTITSGTLIANNTNPTSSATGTGAITIGSAGALLFGQANTKGYVYPGAAIIDNGAVQFDRTDVSANVVANNISGTGTVSQNGTGVTELSGSNSYTGTTTVFQGTLEAGSSTAFGNLSPISFTYNGTLALNGFDVTVGSLSGSVSSGGVNLGANTLTIADSTTSPNFSGTISGSGNLTIGGASTGVILTGSNTYTGSTNVNAGLLLINNASGYGTGTGPINIAAGATFQIGADFNYGAINPTSDITDNGTLAFSLTNSPTIPNSVSGSGGVELLASGIITFPNGNTYSGQTQIQAGTLIVDNASGSATGTGNIYISTGATLEIGNFDTAGSVAAPAITNNGTVVFARTDNTTISSNISGTGGISVQETGGSVTLDGTNSYSGPTVITSGELEDWGAASLSPSSSVQVGSGGSLGINNNETIADLENIGGSGGPVTLASGTTLTIGTGNAALTPFTGTISGPGGITIDTGANSQGFGGQNTYTGVTTMNSGEIFVSSSTVGAPGSITSGPIGTNTLVFTGNGEMSSIINPVTLANAINLNGYNLDNDDATTNLTLTGPISGAYGSITWCTNNVLALMNSNTFTGGVDMREGTLLLGSDTGAGVGGTITLDYNTVLDAAGTGMIRTIANPIYISSSETTFGTNNNNSLTLSGPISGSDTTVFVQTGPAGSLTLTNDNTLSASQFAVDSGTLIAANNGALGSPGNAVYLDGGAGLIVNSGVTISNPIVTLSSPNTIGGSGTISSPAITADNTVILSPTAAPGGGPGNLTFTNALTLASGVAIHFDIHDATGAAGTGYGLITAAGGLDLTASAGTITFNLISTNSTGGTAAAINFNPAVPYSWTFASSSSAITGFNPNQFNLVSSFLNSTNGGTFSFAESGNSLELNFTPVPEPSTWALLAAGVFAVLPLAIRRLRPARA